LESGLEWAFLQDAVFFDSTAVHDVVAKIIKIFFIHAGMEDEYGQMTGNIGVRGSGKGG